jgi:hypothetical protein
MVGPPPGVWKVLRDTDGERFVVPKKAALFKENLKATKKNLSARTSI